MTSVYVLDWVGYDVRGGKARVFSTLEAAQQAGGIKWRQTSETEWEPWCCGDLEDIQVIYVVKVDSEKYRWE